MGYHLTEPYRAPAQVAAKNRVMGFRIEIGIIVRKTAPQPVESHQENHSTVTKPASGIPYWLSRDPIGERGGVNLYGFAGNDGVNYWDYLGLAWHHMLPFSLFMDFGYAKEMSASSPVDIHEAKWGWDFTDDAMHSKLHSAGWITDWRKFLSSAGGTLTETEFEGELERLKKLPKYRSFFCPQYGKQAASRYPAASITSRVLTYWSSRKHIAHANNPFYKSQRMVAGKRVAKKGLFLAFVAWLLGEGDAEAVGVEIAKQAAPGGTGFAVDAVEITNDLVVQPGAEVIEGVGSALNRKKTNSMNSTVGWGEFQTQ